MSARPAARPRAPTVRGADRPDPSPVTIPPALAAPQSADGSKVIGAFAPPPRPGPACFEHDYRFFDPNADRFHQLSLATRSGEGDGMPRHS